MERDAFEFADPEGFTIVEQVIELRPVALELGASVEQLAEDILHLDDVAADGELAAELFLQIGRCGNMVGMGVGFDQPGYCQIVFANIFDNQVRRPV